MKTAAWLNVCVVAVCGLLAGLSMLVAAVCGIITVVGLLICGRLLPSYDAMWFVIIMGTFYAIVASGCWFGYQLITGRNLPEPDAEQVSRRKEKP